jgi:ATP-dependent Lon protease
MDVPWYQETEDNEDLTVVKETLDKNHFGLEKVKERIIEYLAVKIMTGNLKSPILCLYGPPGVGKTSLAKSIAEALNRKFIKCSLGGISDEAEIRGHRRTYVGALPGRIIQGMRKAQVRNPLFLLDEVDKLDSTYKGDPASAMLEVLDPEQNYSFNDNYLEEPYDLSKVLFIATANSLYDIPEPLRDRMELIEMNSYTILEKLEIAKGHLIPKIMERNNLSNDLITFHDEAILYIIEHYTREAGARELERKLETIVRKILVEFLLKKRKCKRAIDVKAVRKYLGTLIFETSKKEKEAQVGVVTGLAYTSYGGEILSIEVNSFVGTGRLVLTGSLGDVMKESARTGISYIRSVSRKHQIADDFFEKHDIHIHIPEGAVPKDGPSAGITMATAMISAITERKVRADVAMTGEITLRGRVLPIGGLKEKLLAAKSAGVKTVVVPEKNMRDVEEITSEITKGLEIIAVSHMDEVLNIALVNEEK